MKYIMIDSCTLRNLIDSHGYSKDLSEIEELISENKLSLITHKLIVQEWTKHKINWQKKKEKKLLGNKQNEQNGEKSVVPFTGIISVDHLPTQSDQIDRLLTNAKEILTTPPIIENEFGNRYRNRLAPCHNKKDSQNDWEIFGSFCNYCEVLGIKELYFLSANHTDFGNEADDNKTIHPHLKERFSSIHIHYFKNHKDFIEEIRKHDGISFELITSTIVANERYSFKTTMRKTVLDSLLFIYNDLYGEISFIPIHILKKYYPFSSSENSHCHYSKFTLSFVSESLITFFSKVKVKEDKQIQLEDEILFQGMSEYKEKIRTVLKKMSLNLIFHVVGEKSHRRVCTHYHEPVTCTCPRCSFGKFQFIVSLEGLQIETDELQENLKLAYIQSQFGNFRSAVKIYDRIVKKAFSEKKSITYFIAKYNQTHLASFLQNFFANETVDNNLVKRLSSIDKLEEAVKLKAHSDYKLLSYIAQEDYFNEAFQEITESTNKIIEHYHSQLKGGWASNGYIWDLIGAFTNLETFLTSNYIIYDAFSNFTKLFETVVEGIFASYAISKDQGDRFEKFDNYWVYRFIFYGNSESIITLLNRYSIRTIPYDPHDTNNDSLLALASNFFQSMRSLKKGQNNNYIEKENRYFERKCYDWFENILTICAILELSEDMLFSTCELILEYLEKELPLPHQSIKSIEYLIDKKGKLLSAEIKYKFLSWGLKNQDCYRDTLLTTLEAFEDEALSNIPDSEFESILKACLFICDKCDRRHEMLLGAFFEKVDKENKNKISKIALDEINEKGDFELCYILWMYEITPFDAKKLMNFISEYKYAGPKKGISFGGRKLNFQITRLDKIINLCFKFDINLKDPIFEQIKNTHLYYQWLLDPDKFDYTHFDAEWVFLYQTSHYLKAMSKSEVLKAYLRNILANKFHIGIERYLLRITNFLEKV